MQPLEQICEATRLHGGAVYQIDGVLYKYLYADPYARLDHPRFKFRPLPGQRKKADLILNKGSIRKCYQVPGYKSSQVSTVAENSVQLRLF